MKNVYQTIQGINGNCWQAVVASLLELDLDEVPHFVSYPDPFKVCDDFMFKHGYVTTRQIPNPRRLKHFGPDLFKEIHKYSGVNGFFKACVYSPKMFTPELMISNNEPIHAVVIDKNFNIVHDPNPEYANVDKYPLEHLLGYNGIISFDCIECVNSGQLQQHNVMESVCAKCGGTGILKGGPTDSRKDEPCTCKQTAP